MKSCIFFQQYRLLSFLFLLNFSEISFSLFFILLLTCHQYLYIFFFLQSGEASRWRVCYQRGLPRLVINRPGVAGAVLQTPSLLIH